MTKSFLEPFHLATGEVDAPRKDPGDCVHQVHQVHIPFPGGRKYFPQFLVCPSTHERANLEIPTVVFNIAAQIAQIAQIPASVPENIKQIVIDAIKWTDLREKPSSLGCIGRIRTAATTDAEKVSMIDILHGLAHAHWQVAAKGSHGFFYSHPRALGIRQVVEYGFDWGRIRNANILDDNMCRDERQESLPIPRRRHARFAPHLRKKFKDTKEGQHLSGEKVFVYDSTDPDGKYVYLGTEPTTTHSLERRGISTGSSSSSSWLSMLDTLPRRLPRPILADLPIPRQSERFQTMMENLPT